MTSIAVDREYLWWTTSQLNTPQAAELARIPLKGGPVEVIAAGADGHGSFSSVVADGAGGAYAASPAGVIRASAQGAQSLLLPSDTAGGPVTAIALDAAANRLYVLTTGKNHIVALPAEGGTPAEVVDGADSTGAIAAVPGGVLFFRRPLGSTGKATLNFAPIGGGAITVVAQGSYPEGSLAVTQDRAVFPADGRVWSAGVPG